MSEDHGAGVVMQRTFYNFTWISKRMPREHRSADAAELRGGFHRVSARHWAIAEPQSPKKASLGPPDGG